MLVAIAGPSSSGKSTIINFFANPNNRRNHIQVVENKFARELLSEMKCTTEDMKKSKELLITYHFNLYHKRLAHEHKLIADSKPDKVILLERTLADTIIYFFLQYHTYFTDESAYNYNQLSLIDILEVYKQNKFFYEFYTACINETKNNFDLILYLENSPAIENDEVRITNLDFINNQKILFNYINETELKDKVRVISSIDLNDRLFDISRILNRLP